MIKLLKGSELTSQGGLIDKDINVRLDYKGTELGVKNEAGQVQILYTIVTWYTEAYIDTKSIQMRVDNFDYENVRTFVDSILDPPFINDFLENLLITKYNIKPELIIKL